MKRIIAINDKVVLTMQGTAQVEFEFNPIGFVYDNVDKTYIIDEDTERKIERTINELSNEYINELNFQENG